MWDKGEKKLMRTVFLVGCWGPSCNLRVLKICGLGKDDKFAANTPFAWDRLFLRQGLDKDAQECTLNGRESSCNPKSLQ